MWHKWVHDSVTPRGDKPRCWWRQLEKAPRGGMPFAHLFPRPPARVAPRATEAERLVQELKHSGSAEPTLEEIVQRHRTAPPKRSWEPVEAWQIVSIERLNAQESRQWGEDGALATEWFDRGDLDCLTAQATLSAQPEADEPPPPTGLRGWLYRFKRWLQPERGFELAGAEQ